MNGDDEGYIEELYNDFLESLEGGGNADFDLDELLEIHDYANDTADGYAAFMSLAQAVNRYPDNGEAAERLALYFYLHNENNAARRQLERIPADSFIRGLLAIALNPPAAVAQTAELLDRLIEGRAPASLNDEDVIRLTDVIIDLGMEAWALRNYERLKSLAEYPDTLMNEVSRLKSEDVDPSLTLKVLNDFTSEYPFSAEAWLQLADFHTTEMPDTEQAENATNYALAIDPKSYDARTHSFDLRFDRGASAEELLATLDGLLADFPQKAEEITAQKALVLQFRSRPREAEDAARRGLLQFPRSIMLYDRLIAGGTIDDDALIAELQKVFAGLEDYEYMTWVDCMKRHTDNKEFREAAIIASFLSRRKEATADSNLQKIMESLYLGKRWDDAIAFYRLTVAVESEHRSLLRLIFMLSLKRTGRIDELRESISKLNIQEDIGRDGNRCENFIETIGVWYFIGNMLQSLSDPTVRESDFDPYLTVAGA